MLTGLTESISGLTVKDSIKHLKHKEAFQCTTVTGVTLAAESATGASMTVLVIVDCTVMIQTFCSWRLARERHSPTRTAGVMSNKAA